MPLALKALTMNGVAVRVVAMRTGAKHLCIAYAMTNVLTPAATLPAVVRAAASDPTASQASSSEYSDSWLSKGTAGRVLLVKSTPRLWMIPLTSIPLKLIKKYYILGAFKF